VIKECPRCSKEKPTSDFYKFYDKWAGKSYYSSRCKPCHLEYKKSNPNTKRNRKAEKLKLRYGLTYAEWEQMRETEDYKCMACGITEQELGRTLDVDHCHTNGKARGILCNKCNTALGHAYDNPDILRALADYVETNKEGYK
jgi:hypothetical protein